MIESKISLTLILPGGTMVSQQVAENKPKEFTEKNEVKFLNTETKKLETMTFRTRKCLPAIQVLNISNMTYKNMLKESPNPKYNKIIGRTKGKLIRVWDTMSEDARIKKHCELIAHDMGAVGFDYTVFSD